MTVLGDHLRHNNTLQVLGISWNDCASTKSHPPPVYIVRMSSEFYLDSTRPRSQWTNNTVHYAHVHDHEKFYCWPKLHKMLDGYEKFWFSETEVILLMSLTDKSLYVKKLKIVRCEISDNAAIAISDFLKTEKMVKMFEFSQNTISGESIKLIVEAIRTNTTLQILDISYNNITDDGVASICECLKHNKVLKVLDISGNNITRQGAKLVENFLQENPALLELYFCNNRSPDSVVVMTISKSL